MVCEPDEFSNDESFVILLLSVILNTRVLGRMSKCPLGVLLLQFFGRETSAAILCQEYFTDNILSSESSL